MSETSEATESLPDLVIDEAWSEYVYPRAAVGDLSHPSEHSGFVRAMRVLRKWANDHDEFWSGLLKMEQAERDEARRKAAATAAALAYLTAEVRKHGDPNLMNRAQIAELAADLGPQVIEHVAAGNCARCGERPMEPGFFVCEGCYYREEAPRV